MNMDRKSKIERKDKTKDRNTPKTDRKTRRTDKKAVGELTSGKMSDQRRKRKRMIAIPSK